MRGHSTRVMAVAGTRSPSAISASPLLSDEHLLTAYRYLARNPVEAGLCARPEDWVWSSYPVAIGRKGRFAFVDASFR